MVSHNYKMLIQRTVMIIFLIAMLVISVVALKVSADNTAEPDEIVTADTSQADENISITEEPEPEHTDMLNVPDDTDPETEAVESTYTEPDETENEADIVTDMEAVAEPETAVESETEAVQIPEPVVDVIETPVQTSPNTVEKEPYFGNPDDSDTITLSFVGDCMLATMLGSDAYGTFNALANSVEPEYFFSGVSDVFLNDDWTIANCENVFTDKDLQATYKNYSPAYWYRSKAENANIFTVGGVEIVSIANNHAKDYGDEGREDTIAALEQYGVEWGDNEKPIILEKSGVKIALLCTTLYYSGYESMIINWIKEVKNEVDFIIIYYHGGTERQYTPDSWRVTASKKMIDAGADVIIGNHPHVLQPVEEYNGGYIIHSLGNFLFGGSRYPENRTVIFQVKLNLAEGKIESDEYNLIPCYVYTDAWKPAVIDNQAEIDQVLNFLNGKASTPLG